MYHIRLMRARSLQKTHSTFCTPLFTVWHAQFRRILTLLLVMNNVKEWRAKFVDECSWNVLQGIYPASSGLHMHSLGYTCTVGVVFSSATEFYMLHFKCNDFLSSAGVNTECDASEWVIICYHQHNVNATKGRRGRQPIGKRNSQKGLVTFPMAVVQRWTRIVMQTP